MNDKRMSPLELEQLYHCTKTPAHPECPIRQWCTNHHFEPDTCEKTWEEYLKQQDTMED